MQKLSVGSDYNSQYELEAQAGRDGEIKDRMEAQGWLKGSGGGKGKQR